MISIPTAYSWIHALKVSSTDTCTCRYAQRYRRRHWWAKQTCRHIYSRFSYAICICICTFFYISVYDQPTDTQPDSQTYCTTCIHPVHRIPAYPSQRGGTPTIYTPFLLTQLQSAIVLSCFPFIQYGSERFHSAIQCVFCRIACDLLIRVCSSSSPIIRAPWTCDSNFK